MGKKDKQAKRGDSKTDWFGTALRELKCHFEEPLSTPTDGKLKAVWPAWNACPPSFSPDEKVALLTGVSQPQFRSELKRLRSAGFGHLPFGSQYDSSLDMARQWTELKEYAEITERLFRDLVERQWAFAEADRQACGRIGIIRAKREMELESPGFLNDPAPTLSDIRKFIDYYQSYLVVRQDAFRQLEKLLYRLPGMSKGQAVELLHRAFGVPHPPPDVPRHLYIARLDALGICSRQRLQDFFGNDFLKLSRAEQEDFYRMRLRTRYGKDAFAPLRIWLADNTPVFRRFDWRPLDIYERARAWNIPAPQILRGDVASEFSKQVSHWGIKLSLKRGVTSLDSASQVKRSILLLTPKPLFS